MRWIARIGVSGIICVVTKSPMERVIVPVLIK